MLVQGKPERGDPMLILPQKLNGTWEYFSLASPAVYARQKLST